jgi:organic radical activating enzyme
MFISESYKEFLQFYEYFQKNNEVIIWGAGENTRLNIDILKDSFNIKAIIDSDNNKVNSYISGIPVLPVNSYFENMKNSILLISPADCDIVKSLVNNNLKLNVNFFYMDKILAMVMFFKYNKLIIPQIQIPLTTRCSLKCKYCSLNIPYYKEPFDIPIESITDSLRLFFKIADKINHLTLIGGEPFLYPNLSQIIESMSKNFEDKISTISVCTNGTIIPKKDVLECFRGNNVLVKISDYSSSVNYREKIKSLEEILQDNGIKYKINKMDSWVDFNILSNKSINGNSNMDDCGMFAPSIVDNNLYYCNLLWSAINIGLIQKSDEDIFCFSNIDTSCDYL